MKMLIVDSNLEMGHSIKDKLQNMRHSPSLVESQEKALMFLAEKPKEDLPAIVLLSIDEGGINLGAETVKKLKESYPSCEVIFGSSNPCYQEAIQSLNSGAFSYIAKPICLDELQKTINKIEQDKELRNKSEILTEAAEIRTKNEKMQRCLDMATKVANTEAPILLSGESGTGKAYLAKFIHNQSERKDQPFVSLNCATLSPKFLETELFGQTKLITGEGFDKTGRLELAHNGTIFLDQVGELSAEAQVKLLRFLQDQSFERVGDAKTIKANVRIIVSSNTSIEQAVKEGIFKEELYYRLNVIEITMPTLKQRQEDIVALAEAYLGRAFIINGNKPKPLSEQAKKVIQMYPWPGNVWELKNAVDRAALLSAGNEVAIEDLPDRIVEHAKIGGDSNVILFPTKTSLEDVEKNHIEQVMKDAGTLEEAASILGIDTSTLWRKRKRYGIT